MGWGCNGTCMAACTGCAGACSDSCSSTSDITPGTERDLERLTDEVMATVDTECDKCGAEMEIQYGTRCPVLVCPYCKYKKIITIL